mgnify:CR=1 FL=1
MNTHHILAWLPPDQRLPLLHRLLIVWAVALPIAVATWMGHKSDGLPHRFDVSLVYSYAISTCIWLLTDVVRFALKRLLHSQGPFYWPPALRASLMLLVGVTVGYGLGTLVGDAYAGVSTWDLWQLNPNRFAGLVLTSVAGVLAVRSRNDAATAALRADAQRVGLQAQTRTDVAQKLLLAVAAVVAALTRRGIDATRLTLKTDKEHSNEGYVEADLY